ncbi:MAG: hypothetical protein JSS02_26065 [Planctomycetes bacterium]|nr:hypothetical protein [Planctomycetota bacterium]
MQVLQILFELSAIHGSEQYTGGDCKLARLLGVDRKTVGTWIDTAAEHEILFTDSYGKGRRRELRINWSAVLTRVRVAACSQEIDDPRLFQFIPDPTPPHNSTTSPVLSTTAEVVLPLHNSQPIDPEVAPSVHNFHPTARQIQDEEDSLFLSKQNTTPHPLNTSEANDASTTTQLSISARQIARTLNRLLDLTERIHAIMSMPARASRRKQAPIPDEWRTAAEILAELGAAAFLKSLDATNWAPEEVAALLRPFQAMRIHNARRIAPGLIITHLRDQPPNTPFGKAAIPDDFERHFLLVRDDPPRAERYRDKILTAYDETAASAFFRQHLSVPVSARLEYAPAGIGQKSIVCQVDVLTGVRRIYDPKSGTTETVPAAPWHPPPSDKGPNPCT